MAAGEERTLEETSTWAVALVCFVLVAISIAVKQIIHHAGVWLKKKRKSSLFEALEKIKSELMLMGFISFLLTVGQQPLSEICVPKNVAQSWHPCKIRVRVDNEYEDPCLKRDKEQLVSAYGIHQFHIFIFMLAIAHIFYCILTYGLGRLKMRKWQLWEDETKTMDMEYQYRNDPERFRFARDTTFGRRHVQFWSKSPIFLWIVSFFRQFVTSVAKVDYMTLRHGFIAAHLTPLSHSSFDFQKYINKSLEKDFKVIVGISPAIWICAVLFLLTNTNGWYSQYWLPFIPLIILLVVGAKLQVIITKMGLRIMERSEVIIGVPLVQPGDNLFWFHRPKLMLFMIHFVLFQNAFQLAFFAWSVYEFGYPSCYHENLEDIIIRMAMSVLIQILCSYVTLPLYALVTQMGTNMKPAIFSENVASALRNWHKTAKKQMKQGRHSASSTPYSSRTASPLHGSVSPIYLLQENRKYNDNNVESDYPVSPGEGTSTSPSHRGVDYYRGDNEIHIQIKMDASQQHQLSTSLD